MLVGWWSVAGWWFAGWVFVVAWMVVVGVVIVIEWLLCSLFCLLMGWLGGGGDSWALLC